MKIFDIAVPSDFRLYCIGDMHVGTTAFAEKKFMELVKDIQKDKQARVVGVGDYVEGRDVSHKFFELDTLDLNTPIAFKQAEEVVRLLSPIKSKILALGEGNHDRYSKGYLGLTNYICKQLGTNFGTWSYIIKFTTPKGSFNGFFTHGSDRRSPVRSTSPIGIRRLINEKLSLISILSTPGHASCVINTCGHYHRLINYSPHENSELYLYLKNGELKQSYKTVEHDGDFIPVFERFYGATGAWMKQYVIEEDGVSTYGERAGYSPVSMGVIVYTIKCGKVKSVDSIEY